MGMREALSFDDVLLAPKRGQLDKREEADISSELVRGIPLALPILSAPMQSVTEVDMAIMMRRCGGSGVLHRFLEPENQAEMMDVVSNVFNGKFSCCAAIGVNEGLERAEHLLRGGCRVFVLDVAHAHSSRVLAFVEEFKSRFPVGSNTFLIVGNVATQDAAIDLAYAGADGIKVGIGPGAACTTREVTGFGVPQLTAIMNVAEGLAWFSSIHLESKPTIIADGGIKNSGDIVKAIAAGADSVMLGRLLAGADESPLPGFYWGMASKKVNGHHAPEGIEGTVPLTGPVENTLKPLAWGLRSAVSYSGGRNLQELRENAEFMRVSPMSAIESGTRLLTG
jgi:IMP dehydrogenase